MGGAARAAHFLRGHQRLGIPELEVEDDSFNRGAIAQKRGHVPCKITCYSYRLISSAWGVLVQTTAAFPFDAARRDGGPGSARCTEPGGDDAEKNSDTRWTVLQAE